MNKKNILRLIISLLLVMLLIPGCCKKTPTLDDASKAYKDGDYKKAVEIFEPAAAQGDPGALVSLGFMYYCGLHVKKDHKKAAELYEKAAQRNNVNAQFSLGTMYENGEGVEKNPAKAYFWYLIAEKQGDKDSKKLRRDIERQLSTNAIKKVQEVLKKWKPIKQE
jgi:hypothetical protein